MRAPCHVNITEHKFQMTLICRYVLAIAGKKLEGDAVQQLSRDEVEQELTLLGLLVFNNNVKESSPSAFRTISGAGIDCKIITGDNAFTAVDLPPPLILLP